MRAEHPRKVLSRLGKSSAGEGGDGAADGPREADQRKALAAIGVVCDLGAIRLQDAQITT